jgi:hypothetical protein
MNVFRYNFFLYIILNELNKIKLTSLNPTISTSVAEKRQIHLTEDDFCSD